VVGSYGAVLGMPEDVVDSDYTGFIRKRGSLFLIKYDSQGNVIYEIKWGENSPGASFIELDSRGDLYVLGLMNIERDFLPLGYEQPVEVRTIDIEVGLSEEHFSSYILKIGQCGTIEWVITGINTGDYIDCVEYDESDDAIVLLTNKEDQNEILFLSVTGDGEVGPLQRLEYTRRSD
jgi:hypothetical protein